MIDQQEAAQTPSERVQQLSTAVSYFASMARGAGKWNPAANMIFEQALKNIEVLRAALEVTP